MLHEVVALGTGLSEERSGTLMFWSLRECAAEFHAHVQFSHARGSSLGYTTVPSLAPCRIGPCFGTILSVWHCGQLLEVPAWVHTCGLDRWIIISDAMKGFLLVYCQCEYVTAP